MHPLLQTGLLTVLGPAVVAVLFLLAASLAAPGRWRSALAAVGLCVAWGVVVWWLVRAPGWPPLQASDWHFYGVALAAVAVLITPWWRGLVVWRLLAGFVFFAVLSGLIIQGFTDGLWAGPKFWLGPAGVAVLAVLGAASVGTVGHFVQAAATFFLLMVFSLLCSVVLVLGGAASLGQGAIICAAACGGAGLVSLLIRRQVDLLPVGFVAATILGGLLLQGVVDGGLPGRAALVLALAWPVLAVVAWALRRGAGSWRVALTLLVLLLPGAAAVWLTWS